MKRYGQQRILLLISIMTVVVMVVTAISLSLLYNRVFDQTRILLVETVQGQARLMEAVARFDYQHSQNDVEGGSHAATISQILDAYENFGRVSKSFEITLGQKQDEQIIFLIPHQYSNDLHTTLSFPFSVPLAGSKVEAMRRALSGESGTIIAPDYKGEDVLAAYEPVHVLDLGIVAKIALAEIRVPFIKAGMTASAIVLALILIGTYLFMRVSSPIFRRLDENERELRALNKGLEQRITERTYELSETSRKYTAIVEQADDCIISIDEKERITLFNPAAEKVFGYSCYVFLYFRAISLEYLIFLQEHSETFFLRSAKQN